MKARDIAAFERSIANFKIVPVEVSKLLALSFLIGEGATVLLVTTVGPSLVIGFTLAAVLLLVFSGALISALARRIPTSCGCFGSTEKAIAPSDLWRNLGLAFVAIVGIITSVLGDSSQIPQMGALIVVGLGAVTYVALWLSLREITELVKRR